MPVKRLLILPFIAIAALTSAASFAQEQPRGMLGDVDLKSRVLSPVPLGPPSHFESAAGVAKPEAAAKPQATARTEPVTPRRVASSKPRQRTTVAARKPKSNPLDSYSYARDPRRQAWPCAGGGICAWTQPR